MNQTHLPFPNLVNQIMAILRKGVGQSATRSTLNKLYFIHIPKTAGRSFREAFSTQGLLTDIPQDTRPHKFPYSNEPVMRRVSEGRWEPYRTLGSYGAVLGDTNTVTLTIIRDPLEWLRSFYCHNNFRGWDQCNVASRFRSQREFYLAYSSPDREWIIPALKTNMMGQAFTATGEPAADIILPLDMVTNFLQQFRLALDPKLLGPRLLPSIGRSPAANVSVECGDAQVDAAVLRSFERQGITRFFERYHQSESNFLADRSLWNGLFFNGRGFRVAPNGSILKDPEAPILASFQSSGPDEFLRQLFLR